MNKIEWARNKYRTDEKYRNKIKEYQRLKMAKRRRSLGIPLRAKKSICKNGHEMSKENLYLTKTGARICKSCHKNRMQRYLAKAGKVKKRQLQIAYRKNFPEKYKFGYSITAEIGLILKEAAKIKTSLIAAEGNLK